MMDTSSDYEVSQSSFQLPPRIHHGLDGAGGFSALATRKRVLGVNGSSNQTEESTSPRFQKTARLYENNVSQVALWDFPKPTPPPPTSNSMVDEGHDMKPRFKVNPKYQQSYLRASDFTGRIAKNVQDDYEKPGMSQASRCPCCVNKEMERSDNCMRD